MADKDDEIPAARWSEPVPVQCLFVEGVEIEMGDAFVRIVGWITLETVEMSRPEKRIVARVVLPASTARSLIRDVRDRLTKGN